MGVLITSGDRLGLRALGSGGRTALSSYDQIIRTLAQSMSPAHVALFAEPSLRGGAIDWFSNFETAGKPAPLRESAPAVREAVRSRLERLVNDILDKAAVLQQSDREGDRVLGEMLQYALEIPSEDAVWLVDGEPVLTFWGHVRDQGQPAENPLKTLISRRPETRADASTDGLRLKRTAVLPIGGAASKAPPAAPTPLSRRSVVAVALWTILAALLLTVGVMLLHACGLRFAGAWTTPFLNYCPVPVDPRIDQERERQAALRTEYDELIRQTELKRQACLLEKPEPKKAEITPAIIPPPVKPIVDQPPKKDDALVIPKKDEKKPNDFDFLKGCWRSDRGITEITDGKDTGKPITITYCFGAGGLGTRTIKYDNETKACRGGLHAQRQGEGLVVEMDRANCDDKTFYLPAHDTCRQGDEGDAVCDEISEGETEPSVKNHRFLKD